MTAITVTQLLDRLQAIEAEGHGDAALYGYIDGNGLHVQAEPADEPAVNVLRAPAIVTRVGGEIQ